MSFGELLLHAQVWPFSLLLLLFFAISLLEIIFVFTGICSDIGLDLSVDIDVPDLSDMGHSWHFLDWLGIGRVPYLITLAAFLFCVSMIGLFAQTVQLQVVGSALPWPLVMPGAVLVALPPVRVLNRALGRVWPKDESSAVAAESLVGHEAELVLGTVTHAEPGQIKFRDSAGAVHHVMAYADQIGDSYASG